uniref:Centrosome and spindle pole associated protein 1 n=1 Tax=Nothobranchius korthausae TaxID=1143690 RepID=A0A1A8EUC3_9TELE
MQPLPVSANEAFPLAAEGLHVDRPNPRRESVLSYQEALKQQIKEREEQKRREEQRYAKLEAAMVAYNPWGRGGGGAPIIDQNGNLVSDLKQMHRINNNKMSAANEAEDPSSHRLADSRHPSPSQQLSAKERYKEELKHQIEEQKRRQAEEREKIRIREEKEEERLAKERARMQQQYEEEQRRQQEAQENLRKMTQEAMTPHKAEVKRTSKQRVPESAKEEKEKTSQQTHEAQQSLQRAPSPPIPTLRRLPSRPSTEINQLSSRAGRSVSAPHATSKVPTPYDGQQEVIRELSALRNCLRKKQNQLELQMDRTAIAHPHLDRRPPRMDAFEFVKDESHPRDSRRAEKQKQSEFNPSKQGGELRAYQQGATRPTEERCERTASRRERVYEEPSTEERGQYHQPPKPTNQSGFRDPSRSARLGVPSAGSTRRRPVSMETVSTEPWLHSGTSDTVKHVTHRQKPGVRSGALPWLVT